MAASAGAGLHSRHGRSQHRGGQRQAAVGASGGGPPLSRPKSAQGLGRCRRAAVSARRGPPPSWWRSGTRRRSARGGVHSHHGRSQHGAVSAGGGRSAGGGPPPSWVAVTEQGGGLAWVGSTPIMVAVSTGRGSIPICSRWWPVQAEDPSRSQLQSAQGGVYPRPSRRASGRDSWSWLSTAYQGISASEYT